MTLATIDERGRPAARIVLLKEVDERGFVFFTNYESRKGADIAANPPNAYKTLQMGSQPEDGATVKADGKDVGVVRCSIESPEFGWIAGARLARAAAVEGSLVDVDGVEAIVQPWSIYDPEKKKPRS